MQKKQKKKHEIKKEITCIVCPRNCSGFITVNYKGYECEKGVKYVIDELIAPQRVLTACILAEKSSDALLPVRTDKGVPKDKIMEIMQMLRSKRVKPPIKIGEVIMSNILGTGANIIACTDLFE
jgi:CxxC motif-containing protein